MFEDICLVCGKSLDDSRPAYCSDYCQSIDYTFPSVSSSSTLSSPHIQGTSPENLPTPGKSALQNKDYRQQDGTPTHDQEMERVVFGSPEHLAARHGREVVARAAMFTNAHINAIHGGTFLNVAHIHEYDSGPVFPMMVLGLQAVSLATRSHYPHCIHPTNAPPLLITEPTSTSGLAIHVPFIYQEMRTAIGPLALWLLIKMWIQRRSTEHY